MAGSVRDEGGGPDRNNINGEKKASHELRMVSIHMYVCMYTDVLYMHCTYVEGVMCIGLMHF